MKPDEPDVPGLDAEFMRLKVAKAWGLTPALFRAQPPDDQAQMIAYEMFSETCTAYQYEWRDKHREMTKDGKTENGFEAMRSHMGLLRKTLSLKERVDLKLGIK